MDVGHLWGMVTARSAQPSGGGRGYGTLTPEEVRMALSGLGKAEFAAGMFVFAGDDHSFGPFYDNLWRTVHRIGQAEHWQRVYGKPFKCRACAYPLKKNYVRPGYVKAGEVEERCTLCGGTGTALMRADTKLCILVIVDQFMGRRCKHCNGKGRIELEVQATHCPICGGRGKLNLTHKNKADFFGVDRPNWTRKWERRYRQASSICDSWLGTAESHLKKAVQSRV